MQTRKLFNCQACDAEMEVADLQEQQVACRQCGRNHRMTYSSESQAWRLQADEPVETDPGQRPEEAPFSVLGEVGRPKRVDRSEEHREQTDIHAGDEAVDKKARRER